MHNLISEYADTFETLSTLKASDPIPVGMLGTVYSALDNMRWAKASSQNVAIVEQISIGIRRLEMARRKRDDVAEQAIRENLNSFASSWIKSHHAPIDELAEAAE